MLLYHYSYKMWKTEKKINKRIVWAVIGSTVAGLLGASMTPKGKSFWHKIFDKTKRRTIYLNEWWTETIKILKQVVNKK